MSVHLREAWHHVAVDTVTLFHGTNRGAFDQILRDGEFKKSNPEAVAHEVERRYGLPYNSVWMHKYNEFSRGRASDPHIYFTNNKAIAREYAELGSEVVFDALNCVIHILKWDELVDDDGNYRPGAAEKRKGWIAEETRKHYSPVVLTVEIPTEIAGYGFDTTHIPGPLPASWIVGVDR